MLSNIDVLDNRLFKKTLESAIFLTGLWRFNKYMVGEKTVRNVYPMLPKAPFKVSGLSYTISAVLLIVSFFFDSCMLLPLPMLRLLSSKGQGRKDFRK